jgi:AcrR family transcriptional regulator
MPTIAKPRPGTAEKLIESTVDLLGAGGYAAASVQAITGGAGVAAGTLYRHFESKEALFVEVFRRLSGRELDAMSAASSAEQPTEVDRLAAAIEAFARRALANPRLAWALLAEPVDPLVDAERLTFRRRYRDLVRGILDDAVAAGEIPKSHTELTAAALVGAVGEALVGPLAAGPGDKRHADELVREIVTFTRRAAGQ